MKSDGFFSQCLRIHGRPAQYRRKDIRQLNIDLPANIWAEPRRQTRTLVKRADRWQDGQKRVHEPNSPACDFGVGCSFRGITFLRAPQAALKPCRRYE
jgi:hypothetical protein